MAITQAGTTLRIEANTTSNTGTVSAAITVPADAEIAVVAVSAYGRSDTSNYMSGGSVTLTKGSADTAMTSVGGGDASTATWQAAMWYLTLPDTGASKSLKWDWAGSSTSEDDKKNWTLTFWKGIDTASPVRDADGAQAGSLPVTTPTLTAASGDLIVAFCATFNGAQDGSATIDTWSNLTELTEIAHDAYAEGAWATGSPSGNTTVGASSGTSWGESALVAVVLKPVAEEEPAGVGQAVSFGYEAIRFGRMLDFSMYAATPAAAEEPEAETTAWVAEVVDNGGSVSAGRQTIVNDLIAGLKADGIWSKLDRLWLFAAEDQPSALTDLKGLTLATAVNSPTFTADQGYTGNNSNNYVDTNFNPSTAGGSFVQDSACLFAWNNSTSASGLGFCGAYAAGTNDAIIEMGIGANSLIKLNNSSGFILIGTPSPADGLYVGNRTSASTITLDRNGSQIATDSITSSGLPNANCRVLSDASGVFTDKQMACFGCGGGLSSGDRTAIYTRLGTYMAAL